MEPQAESISDIKSNMSVKDIYNSLSNLFIVLVNRDSSPPP